MDPVLTAACVAGLSQALLTLALLVRLPARGVREWLFAGLLLAAACHLSAPLLPALAPFIAPWATAIPGLFWLFSGAVFDDHFRLTFTRSLPVLITVFFPMLGMLLGRPPAAELLLFTLPQLLEFVLLALALWVVIEHWSTDLVESRRRLRVWFVGLIGIGVFLLILAREVLFPGQAWLATWQYAFAAALLLGINLMLLELRAGTLFAARSFEAPAGSPLEAGEGQGQGQVASDEADPEIDQALVARIERFMAAERAWQEMGLTIGELAARIDVPQYRLRRAINGGLGYRNVSDFLNSYRIREAAERLADPEAAGLPVLTIAMDAGFRSLSSFNKAFKEAHQTTPTQFRKAALAGKC